MMQTLPKGTYTPLVTPFTESGEIDFQALENLIARQLDARVEALVMLGTTGESPTVSPREFEKIIQFVVNWVQTQAAIIACIGNNDTTASIQSAQMARNLGVDGLLVLCPYYSKPTQQGLYLHFEAIAKAVALPQLIYNIHGRTAVNIETDTLKKLSDLSNVVGVKEASNTIEQISECIQQLPDEFLVLSGCDHLNYPLLSLGGDGVISTLANLVPYQVKAMVDLALSENYTAARELHYQLLPLAQGCFIETNPIPIKTALAEQGLVSESFRLPLCKMNPGNRKKWQTILADFDNNPQYKERLNFHGKHAYT